MIFKWTLILLGYLSSYGVWTSPEVVDVFIFMIFGGVCFAGALYMDFGRRMK